MDQKKLAAAYLMISKGFAALAEAHGASVDDDDDVPVKTTKAKAEIEGKKESNKGTSKESSDKEDSPSPKSGKAAAKALAELQKMDIDSVTRPELIPYALALGVETQAVVTNELRAALKKLAKEGASSAADEDDEKPAKGKKAKADADDEIEYPDKKTMKQQMRTFAKANKKQLIANIGPEYFDEDDDDTKNPQERLHLTLNDEDQLKEAWKDNVYPAIEDGTWKKIEKKAAAAEDDE